MTSVWSRAILALLLLSVGISSPTPLYAGLCSLGQAAQMLSELHSESSVARYLTSWHEAPLDFPKVDQWVESVLRLSAASKRKILDHLKTHPLKDAAAERLLKLALYDEPEWLRYWAEMHELTGSAASHAGFLTSLQPVVLSMPPELLRKLMARVPLDYTKSKRPIDAFLRSRFKPEVLIPLAVTYGNTPLQAYQRYLGNVQKLFKRTDRGGYSANTVTVAANAIQEYLAKMPRGDLPDGKLTIFGSLPNGKADLLSSDIDLNVLSAAQKEKLKPHLKAMAEQVNAALARAGIQAKLKVTVNRSSITTDLSPIQIEVTPLKTELLVYRASPRDLATVPAVAARYELASPSPRGLVSAIPSARLDLALASKDYGFTVGGKTAPKSPIPSYDPVQPVSQKLLNAFYDRDFAKGYAERLQRDVLAEMSKSSDPEVVAAAKKGLPSEAYVTVVLENRFKARGYAGHFEVKDCCADTRHLQKQVLQRALREKKFFLDPVQAKSKSQHGVTSHAAQMDMAFEVLGEEEFHELFGWVAGGEDGSLVGSPGTRAGWEAIFDAYGPNGRGLNNPANVIQLLRAVVPIH